MEYVHDVTETLYVMCLAVATRYNSDATRSIARAHKDSGLMIWFLDVSGNYDI